MEFTSSVAKFRNVLEVLNGITVDMGSPDEKVIIYTENKILRIQKSDTEFPGLIIPKHFAHLLSHVDGKHAQWKKIVKGRHTPSSVAFLIDGQYYQTELIDDEYPEYSRLIPQNPSCEIILNRSDMIAVLNHFIPVCRPNVPVRWHVSQHSSLRMNDAKKKISGEFNISGDHQGERITIRLNPFLTKTVLESFSGERIVAKLTSRMSPVIWMDNEDSSDSLRLLMPVRMN